MRAVAAHLLRITPGRAVVVLLKLFGIEALFYLVWISLQRVLPLFGVFPPPDGDGVALIVITVLATAIVIYAELHRAGVSWRGLWSWRVEPPAVVVPLALLVIGGGILFSELDNLLQWFWPAPDWIGEIFAELQDPDINPIVGPLTVIVMAPVVEELFFRGLLLHGLLRVWRPAPAILFSSALFAFGHLNPWQLIVASGFGMILGWIYYRTSSLTLCMACHALHNSISFFVTDLPFEISGFNATDLGDTHAFQPWWFDVLGLVMLIAGAVLFHRLAPPGRHLQIAAGNALGAEPPLLDASHQMSAELAILVTSLAQRARAASLVLATAPTSKKDAALRHLADLIDGSHAALLTANLQDLASPEAAALTPAARDRLTLNPARLKHLAESVREVIALPDPVGDVLEEIQRPNGLRIRKLRVPIGVIGIIYEARPNVTIDCAILCLKSGNACILRGGKECFHTNTALAALISQALVTAGLPTDAVQLVPTTDRAALITLLKLDTLIHCIIPRGGENLIRYVAANSTIPVIKHYKGVCFVYVDAAADLAMAEAITLNAKVQRPSACNAAEQLLVHRSVAEKFLPSVARALVASQVELRCDAASAAILARDQLTTTPATLADFSTEFLDYVLAVRVVDSLDGAIATINRDSSNHSDAIVTTDEAAAQRFLAEVDSATVYWNASTRFTDGYEFGYGAEIGISTDRLHARGPMGLRELCTHKFVIEGTGQVRG
jgi:glutamate-5-semialdehyde dehydrogenase